jgi:hypothetical protein
MNLNYERFEVFMAMSMKNTVFCDIKSSSTSQETNYVSEEWCLLGCYAVWLL